LRKSSENPSLSDQYFVDYFISGLKDHIKLPFGSHNPHTLVQVYALARNYENYTLKKAQYESPRRGFRVTSLGVQSYFLVQTTISTNKNDRK
jgi:hypothetical protein